MSECIGDIRANVKSPNLLNKLRFHDLGPVSMNKRCHISLKTSIFVADQRGLLYDCFNKLFDCPKKFPKCSPIGEWSDHSLIIKA